MEISAVIPFLNEEKNLKPLYKRLKIVLEKISDSHEIIFVNDGSTDKSEILVKSIIKKDSKTKLISFSRNFGHMAAIHAGLTSSKGNWVTVLDADLQDPPETILKMYKKAMEGFEVIYGIKTKRKEDVFRRTLFKAYYILLNSISYYKMPLDSGTFSLLNRRVVNILTKLPERNKYFSGLRAWTGFRQTGILYERDKRYKGKPASFRRLFNLAFDGLLSFSYVPLRISSFLGIIFAAFAFLFILIIFILRLFFQIGIIGWASTISTILLIGGVQLITLGIIGEYMARIYDEVKKRPEYIVKEKIGIKK